MVKEEKRGLWNGTEGSQLFIFSSVIIYQSILGNHLKWVGVCNLLPVGAVICTMKKEKLYIWHIIQGWDGVGRRKKFPSHCEKSCLFQQWGYRLCDADMSRFSMARNLAAFIQGKNISKDDSVLSLAPGNTSGQQSGHKSVSHQSWCLQSMSAFHGSVPTNSLKWEMECAKCRNKQKPLNLKTHPPTFPHCPIRKGQNWTHVKIHSSW